MADSLQFALLSNLLSAEDPSARAQAWADFLNGASKLLLRTAHSLGGGYDAAMNRYTFMLEQLQRDDFRRLRGFEPEGCGKLSTWLVVVARRLCLDYERQRYGRLRSQDAEKREVHAGRRRLADLAVEELDVARFAAVDTDDALTRLCDDELHHAIEQALASFAPDEQLLIKLRFADGLSAAAIARIMNFPTAFHVYRRSAQLLNALRQTLARQGVEVASAVKRARPAKASASVSIPRLRSVP